jgi:hypothetical protein
LNLESFFHVKDPYLVIGLAGLVGAGIAGEPVGALAGADCCGVVSLDFPTTEVLDPGPWMKARNKEVSIKTTATIVVNLVRKVVAPLLPKIV